MGDQRLSGGSQRVADILIDFVPETETQYSRLLRILLLSGEDTPEERNTIIFGNEKEEWQHLRYYISVDERDPRIAQCSGSSDSNLKVQVRISREPRQLVPVSSKESHPKDMIMNASASENRSVKIEPSFRTDTIALNLTTGSITAASTQRHWERVPRTPVRGQRATPRKLIPGTNVSLLAKGNGKYVRADPSELGLYADRNLAMRDEVFSVIRVPFNDNAIALRSAGNHRYFCCSSNYKSVRADCEQPSYHSCFFEEDAGSGLIAIRAAFNDQYVGSGSPLKLADRVGEWEKFAVVPVVDMF